jgi:DNA-binding response OmpR family regulator
VTDAPNILVVDDDPEMREALDEYLSGRGLRVLLAANGTQMHSALSDHAVDLVLLDLKLPGENGMQLMQDIRRANDKPLGIIIVTGVGDPEDRVLGLETGADDYVVKPFDLRELLARIHSVLRRLRQSDRVERDAGAHPTRFAGWTLQEADNLLIHDDGRRSVLSAGELDLVRVLVEHLGSPVSRDVLLARSSHRDLEPFDRAIDVRIARLRRKIEDNPAHPRIIRTVRNVGYVLLAND